VIDRVKSETLGVPLAGQGLQLLEQIARETLPPTSSYEWTAMSYQEKEIGNQIYIVCALSLLLVYLVLAGQYESWIVPLTVIVSVPPTLLGTAAALLAPRRTQQPLHPDWSHFADRAIGQERHSDRRVRARLAPR
jgi:multidrug efflux pump subunit AcrB